MLEVEKLLVLFALTTKQIIPYQSFTVYERAPYIQQLHFHLLIIIVLKEKNVFVCHSSPFFFFLPSSFVLGLCPPLHPTFAYGSRLESNYFIHARNQLWNPQKELRKEKLLSALSLLLPPAEKPRSECAWPEFSTSQKKIGRHFSQCLLTQKW